MASRTSAPRSTTKQASATAPGCPDARLSERRDAKRSPLGRPGAAAAAPSPPGAARRTTRSTTSALPSCSARRRAVSPMPGSQVWAQASKLVGSSGGRSVATSSFPGSSRRMAPSPSACAKRSRLAASQPPGVASSPETRPASSCHAETRTWPWLSPSMACVSPPGTMRGSDCRKWPGPSFSGARPRQSTPAVEEKEPSSSLPRGPASGLGASGGPGPAAAWLLAQGRLPSQSRPKDSVAPQRKPVFTRSG
mmetsp:Transcript_10209/g.31700  ORF Transcript_10209/g.31700 Transcript_10209/m.31700 type:complete len:251 (-) Transcript_10209:509-1261(-)